MYRLTNLNFSIMLIVIILLATALSMIVTFGLKQIRTIVSDEAYAVTGKLINSTSIDYKVGKNDGSIAAVHDFSGLNGLHYNSSFNQGSNQYQAGYVAGYNEEWKRLSAPNSTISMSSGYQGIQQYPNENCQGILSLLGDCDSKAGMTITSNEAIGDRQHYQHENCQGILFWMGDCDSK
jgi:hypothetical protein